jgi:Flp pilus assembly pilin Flp
MYDVARLGLMVDSSSVVAATPALDRMTVASEKAEAAAEGLAVAEKAQAEATNTATRATDASAKAEISASHAVIQRTKVTHEVAGASQGAAAAATGMASADKSVTVAATQAEAAVERFNVTTSVGVAAQNGAAAAAKAHTAALQAQAAAARATANTQRMLGFQINDIVVSLASGMNPAMVALQQGSQIAQMGLKDVAFAALGMARTFAPVLAVVGLASAAIAGMTAEINKSSSVTVEFGDVALATWQVVAGGIYSTIQPAVEWLVGTLSNFWSFIAPGLKAAGNGIIATFLGIFDAVKATWDALTNNILAGLDMLATGSTDRIVLGVGEIAQDVAGAFSGAFGNDYLGAFFGAVSNQAQSNAMSRLAADAEDAKGKVKALRTDGMEPLVGSLTTFGNAVKDAFSNLGSGIVDAFTKGGNVAQNFFSLILDKVGQVGESLLNTGLNSLLNIGLGSLFGAQTGGVMGNGLWGSAIFSAKGNVFNSPSLSAYSNQIVSQPTMFAFAKGAGVMGEAGPEAIMPLRRTSDGRLGVAAMNDNGSSGAGGISIGNITIQANSEAEGAAGARGFHAEMRRLFPTEMAYYQRNPNRRAG